MYFLYYLIVPDLIRSIQKPICKTLGKSLKYRIEISIGLPLHISRHLLYDRPRQPPLYSALSFSRDSRASHNAISTSTFATMRCCSASGGRGSRISFNFMIDKFGCKLSEMPLNT